MTTNSQIPRFQRRRSWGVNAGVLSRSRGSQRDFPTFQGRMEALEHQTPLQSGIWDRDLSLWIPGSSSEPEHVDPSFPIQLSSELRRIGPKKKKKVGSRIPASPTVSALLGARKAGKQNSSFSWSQENRAAEWILGSAPQILGWILGSAPPKCCSELWDEFWGEFRDLLPRMLGWILGTTPKILG